MYFTLVKKPNLSKYISHLLRKKKGLYLPVVGNLFRAGWGKALPNSCVSSILCESSVYQETGVKAEGINCEFGVSFFMTWFLFYHRCVGFTK